MPFKTILAVVGVDQGDRDIEAAVGICREAGAHLSVLVLGLASPPPVGAYAAVVSDAWMEERDAEMKRLKARVDAIEALVAKEGITADVECEYAELAWTDAVAGRRARYADLTIIGPDLIADGELKNYVLHGALFDSGRPLLLAPAGRTATLRPKRIMLAWDSRVEAARAAHEAVELIAAAEEVRIALVDPEAGDLAQGDEPGADVAAWLARHGAKVAVDRLASGGRSVVNVLRQHAVDCGADLMVMGGYGHSRVRERIFGGVTKSMIDEPPLPVFMAR
jgi:nucleotide-binding universal stress UspA family protein